MANWASTSYRIEGSKEDLNKLYEVIDNFMKQRQVPVTETASIDWEGNIVKALGATDEQMRKNYLRGFIQTYELDGDTISIEAEEAWGATDFRHVLTELMPELTVYYIVEEPGCEVYATNDSEGKYFIDRFCVDACINGDYNSDYFETGEQAMKYAASLLRKEKVTMDEVKKWSESQQGDDFLYIYEFKYEP
uniref:DUF4494 domain-containing protein n=1 Tax=Prevotella sp. GTC17254 TaxID=3236794 RepID=A0AB33J1L6_9BACT